MKRGVSILSIEELVAVVLNTGTKTQTVSKLSGQVARLIRKRSTITKEALMPLGLGPYKVAQILAALELGSRANPSDSIKLTSASQVFANSYEIIGQDKETVLCFYLNARGELLKKEIIAVGTLNRASLLPREIFSLVKELPVAAIILVHNHPSGNLEPSKEDTLFTKRVKASADILGIQLLDHLIVSKEGWRKIPL